MNQAAEKVYQTIRKEGSQASLLGSMMTREKLYEHLDYYRYEKKIDELFSKDQTESKSQGDSSP